MSEELSALRRRLATGPAAPAHRRSDGSASDAAPDDHDAADDDPDEGDADGAHGEVPAWLPDGTPRGPGAWLAALRAGGGPMAALRADPGRAGGLALAAIAALAILITVFTLIRSQPAPVAAVDLPPVRPPVSAASRSPAPGSPAPGSPAPGGPAQLVVSVVGLVAQPGLVTVAPDARVADAVAAAGGAVRGADTLGLNLARHVADGEQIVVGLAAPAGQPRTLGSAIHPGSPPPAAPGSPAGGPRPPAGPVDLNTATVDQLDALPGVGPVTAAAIIAWRQANGRFTAVDQLAEVDGIGPARLEKLRPLVTV